MYLFDVNEIWMCFKKFGTVYDVFMVRKRLRNGQKYGFVRFKNIDDVEKLYQSLCNTQIGKERLRIYKAFERRGEVRKRER